jgi:hypothetical protein
MRSALTGQPHRSGCQAGHAAHPHDPQRPHKSLHTQGPPRSINRYANVFRLRRAPPWQLEECTQELA